MLITAVLLSTVQREALGQMKGRFMCIIADLSCFPSPVGCTATSKLSHNAWLNFDVKWLHGYIIYFSVKYALWWQTPQCHIHCGHTSHLPLHCAQITHMLVWLAPGIIWCIWIWILKLWHCQVLNGIKVHVLMGSPSEINYVFMYGYAGRYKCLH